MPLDLANRFIKQPKGQKLCKIKTNLTIYKIKMADNDEKTREIAHSSSVNDQLANATGDDSSGLLTKSDNVEEAVKEELVNLIQETADIDNIQISSPENANPHKNSGSLTCSIHEMVDDLQKLKVDNSTDSSDEFQDAKSTTQSPVHSKENSPTNTSSTGEDATLSSSWRNKLKHFFILSEAGKPIYSRHGDEDQLASLMAVMQATVSFVQDMGDNIRAIRSKGTTIVFLNRKPLILVGVSHMLDNVTQLIVQMTYMYHQVLSVMTQSQLTRIFDQKKGYDLRKMIAGSERLLDSLAHSMEEDPAPFMLSAVQVLPMPSSLRDNVSSVIKQYCSKTQNVVFALLIANNRLITLVRMKKYYIHPADLHLIFNLVNSSESFKLSESWTPICLPKFDSR